MSNTFNEFKEGMGWTVLELRDSQLEEIFESIDYESFSELEDIEAEFGYEDHLVVFDVNLHSVVESFSEVIKGGKMAWLQFFYLENDDMYAGVLTYDC